MKGSSNGKTRVRTLRVPHQIDAEIERQCQRSKRDYTALILDAVQIYLAQTPQADSARTMAPESVYHMNFDECFPFLK
ncbi:hypothetical protein H4F33_03955 [Pectobacterium brasiliense]|uniref:hypothetical protein n=1 Tax=Pectobacterium brasiliense TaxID=180957 RepID=UPI0015DF55A0|nr:hypothetical protein [Pectobacterium brasiliense]MBA0216458.1 hypothetical protein [Pectobacterium brasiliense]MBN3071282.1 hypothetical protein [Pectobacterium brasiliense]MBN3167916.1 hypothetical protein [Pectobacterium brasiliense]